LVVRYFGPMDNITRKLENKTKYNPSIHHRKSIRLKGYDYSQEGWYFITICTYNRECWFGNIVNKKMILNDAGKIADECWLKIPEHFPNAILHEHIVMPNHVHGIIELTVGVQNFEPLPPPQNFEPLPPPQNFEPLPPPQNFEPLPPQIQRCNDKSPQNEFQKIIPRSIGSIIRGYKIGVTKFFRNNTDIHNVWQRNFHEHIIRNEQSYWRISEYIINNPEVWANDKFHKA
jgi:putative transposase